LFVYELLAGVDSLNILFGAVSSAHTYNSTRLTICHGHGIDVVFPYVVCDPIANHRVLVITPSINVLAHNSGFKPARPAQA
jgi:hypothetical protein